MAGLIGELGALTSGGGCADASDLLLLASADLLVCSLSSYSLTAAWLGAMPYLWLRDQLHDDDGWLSMWGAGPVSARDSTAANRHYQAGAATPVARHPGAAVRRAV